MCAEVTPAQARAVARALLDLADTAERDGRPGASAERERQRGQGLSLSM